jgi:acyl-CoA thioester hydrolase
VADEPRNPSEFTVDLRWTDFDGYGHLHSSGQVMVLENARARFLNSILAPGGQLEWVLVHFSLDIRSELREDEGKQAVCRIGLTEFGNTSLRIQESIESLSGRVVSEATCVVALWDQVAHATVELTSEQRSALESLGVPTRAPR